MSKKTFHPCLEREREREREVLSLSLSLRSTNWTFFVFWYHDFPCIWLSVFFSFSEISGPILTCARGYKQNPFNHTLSENLSFLFHCLHKLVSYMKVKNNLTGALFTDTNVTARNKNLVLLVVHAHTHSLAISSFSDTMLPPVCDIRIHTLMQCIHTHTPLQRLSIYMCYILHIPGEAWKRGRSMWVAFRAHSPIFTSPRCSRCLWCPFHFGFAFVFLWCC